jgi:glycosyltransferase involved in cell wall biosynthesis
VPIQLFSSRSQSFLPHERIFSVHNGIETFKFSPPLQKTKSHTQVLHLSNLTRTKGFFVLLEAIPQVIAHLKDIRFVFAGAWKDIRDKADAEKFVREKQLQDFVVWKGPVVGEAKEQLFYESDIFVFPTFYPIETFGIVNLEAMQAGLPIITTGRAAIPEVVEDGVNGFIVPEQDPNAVAEKILLLAQDEHLRQRMRENNLKKFHQFYTKEKYAERLIRTIEQIHALHIQAHA